MELQNQLAVSSRSGPVTPDQVEVMRTTVGAYNTKLEALVGADVAEAYRHQGMGQIFSSFRPATSVTK
jgi:hypothetical protein